MKKYKVGGAVRDELLGLVPEDDDYVIVGATPEQMLALGYQQVGADFPVFLHPVTREEHALARTERKSGWGHKGFVTAYDPNVTLFDDLVRRDLTINAMAKDEDGRLIDPHGGRKDLQDGILRAVSPAFAEDPLRVLRIARFAARYGFAIDPETADMCRQVAASDEFAGLTAERVGGELMKALGTAQPEQFFRALASLDALHQHFPEIHDLIGQSQPEEHHPEGDAFEHTMLVLRQAASMTKDVDLRFAALVHDLGKGLTPKELLPKHHGHEEAGVPLVAALSHRLRLPTDTRRKGQVAARYHAYVHRIEEMNASRISRLADEIGATHSRGNVELLSLIGLCDRRGRLGREDADYPQAAYFEGVMDAVAGAKFRDRFTPEEIRGMSVERRQNEQARMRVDAVKSWLHDRHHADSTAPAP